MRTDGSGQTAGGSGGKNAGDGSGSGATTPTTNNTSSSTAQHLARERFDARLERCDGPILALARRRLRLAESRRDGLLRALRLRRKFGLCRLYVGHTALEQGTCAHAAVRSSSAFSATASSRLTSARIPERVCA